MGRRAGTIVGQLLDALEKAGLAYRFDAETGGTPVPHDRLLLDLAALAPELELDDVEQEGPEPGVEDYVYAVRCTSRGRRYEVRCGDQSEWYDHEAVAGLLNEVLAAGGSPNRLQLLFLDGQYPIYASAPREAVAAARQLGLFPRMD